MGWTGGQAPRPRNAMNLIAFGCGDDFAKRVIKTHKDGKTIYAAVRAKDSDDVFALVLLTDSGPNGTLYTKPVTEDMGPAEDHCPASILDLLTDTDAEYAIEWRKRCRARLGRRKAGKGDTVKFADAIAFTDGSEHQTFRFQGGSRFRTSDEKLVYITRWRDREHEVVPAG